MLLLHPRPFFSITDLLVQQQSIRVAILLKLIQDQIRILGKDRTGDHSRVGLDGFVIVVSILSGCQIHRLVLSPPQKDALIFGPTGDVLAVMTEGGTDLTAVIGQAFVLAGQAQIAKVVDSDPTVVGRH